MRSSGILLHITSLPNTYGIGDLGPCAYAMADTMAGACQTYWQILPVNPTDAINGNSPYSCSSAFAGNPLLISPLLLVKEGLLSARDVADVPDLPKDAVDYARVGIFKQKLFERAFMRWDKVKDKDDYQRFCLAQGSWLNDYACFVAAKIHYKGKCWREWPPGLCHRRPAALAKFARSQAIQIRRVKFIQYLFFQQWNNFKAYANKAGIQIIGDIPIYVNYDSAEVWCNSRIFKLKPNGELLFVSGCPPDYFSKTGQRWGNPVYDWGQMKKDGYGWWVRRIKHNLSMFDVLRIDHFRGFMSFWQIPAHKKFAVFGRWVKSPGKDFFRVLRAKLGNLPLIAEDLGEITADVTALMEMYKFPGMRVLLFSFSGNAATNPHVPVNYSNNCVAYTGTHDNNTIAGWYHCEAQPGEKAALAKVFGQNIRPRELHWDMITALMKSRANMVIFPLTDVLGLRENARMNTPGTTSHNWKWRLNGRLLTKPVLDKLFKLTRRHKRV